MKSSSVWFLFLVSSLVSAPAAAQLIPDASVGTLVTPETATRDRVDGGIIRGANLFHSFQQFNIATGRSVYFANPTGITNILTRVTGTTLSTINGTLGVAGPANLFLLNPNGITFGTTARLDVSGSFIGTTATGIKFEDGTLLRTDAAPLLTMSVPVGLQFRQNPGAIINRANSGLTVKTGQTLGLVGGAVTLDKGRLTAPSGRVEIGSVGSDRTVALQRTNPGWAFDYTGIQDFQDINITNAARINVNGAGGGAIQLQGRRIQVDGLSQITSHTTGATNGQSIIVRGSERIQLAGADLDAETATTIGADVGSSSNQTAAGNGSSISLEAPVIRVQDGARIRTRVYGTGKGGDVVAKADQIEFLRDYGIPDDRYASTFAANTETNSIGNGGTVSLEANTIAIRDGAELRASARGAGNGGNIRVKANSLSVTGESTTGDPGWLTGMSTSIRELATGQGGDIVLEVGQLEVLNGPAIRTGTYGKGNAGNIYVTANEATIAGNANSGIVSRFYTSAYISEDDDGTPRPERSTGNGGNIVFNVGQLRLLNGGKISASSETQGRAGEIVINAQSIDIAGQSQSPILLDYSYSLDAQGPSGLFAFSQERQGVSLDYADAGSIRIQTHRLSVRDNAQIVVSSDTTTSNAGNILVNTSAISLDQRGSIRAESRTGTEGNINLSARTLVLNNGSQITTNARETANGGNIRIGADAIVQFGNSDITANAIKGQGGSIAIATQALIGGVFRPQLTPENDITASSEFGLTGSVQITNPDVNPNSGLIQLPTALVDPSRQIANRCNANTGSQFVSTGRGGVPATPSESMNSDRTWVDLRAEVTSDTEAAIGTEHSLNKTAILVPLVEASQLQRNAKGQIELVAMGTVRPSFDETCAVNGQLINR